jgi:hypothetical protein
MSLKKPDLFDHLVGAGKQHGRHLDADRLRCDQVHHKIEFGCLLDRDVARLGSMQNLVDIVCDPSQA